MPPQLAFWGFGDQTQDSMLARQASPAPPLENFTLSSPSFLHPFPPSFCIFSFNIHCLCWCYLQCRGFSGESVVKFLPFGAHKPAGEAGKTLHRGRHSIYHLSDHRLGGVKREADWLIAGGVCLGCQPVWLRPVFPSVSLGVLGSGEGRWLGQEGDEAQGSE